MGVLNIVKTVKNIYKEYVVLVKIGKFYYCYGRDSYIISYLTNYKINLLEDNTYSCSFSTNAYNKVISILEDKKINYLILDRNFYFHHREIDIIAKDLYANEITFVEVKTRSNSKFGSPVDSVDNNKIRHLLSACRYYLYKNRWRKGIRFNRL